MINPEVPIAFDENGKALTYESKSFLFAFPGLHTVIYLIFSILGRYPQIIKYPIQEKTENKMELYLYGRKLILYIKIMTSFLFWTIIENFWWVFITQNHYIKEYKN